MKVLYAIQTTGNGHVTRSKEIISILEKRVEVDVVFSGPKNKLLTIKNKVIKHYKGLTFYYTKKGQINWVKTFIKNNLIQFVLDVLRCNTKEYDLVINDFEPITAWSCYLTNRRCVALSNQYAMLSDKEFVKAAKHKLTINFLKYFAPTKKGYGFHLVQRGKNIFQPVIRKKIRKLEVSDKGHIVVYLPNYSLKKQLDVFSQFKQHDWIVFSPHQKKPSANGNIRLEPINENTFIKKLVSCKAVISSSGFSTLSEVLFLNKPFLTIPVNSHMEQAYNAKIVKHLGGTVLTKLSLKKTEKIQHWLNNLKPIKLSYSLSYQDIVDEILIDYIKSIADLKIAAETT